MRKQNGVCSLGPLEVFSGFVEVFSLAREPKFVLISELFLLRALRMIRKRGEAVFWTDKNMTHSLPTPSTTPTLPLCAQVSYDEFKAALQTGREEKKAIDTE